VHLEVEAGLLEAAHLVTSRRFESDDVEPGLLAHLTPNGVLDRLAELDAASRKQPLALERTAAHQHEEYAPALVARDEIRTDARRFARGMGIGRCGVLRDASVA
jgi:hypothetical protein